MICPYDILLLKARHFRINRDGDSEKFNTRTWPCFMVFSADLNFYSRFILKLCMRALGGRRAVN